MADLLLLYEACQADTTGFLKAYIHVHNTTFSSDHPQSKAEASEMCRSICSLMIVALRGLPTVAFNRVHLATPPSPPSLSPTHRLQSQPEGLLTAVLLSINNLALELSLNRSEKFTLPI